MILTKSIFAIVSLGLAVLALQNFPPSEKHYIYAQGDSRSGESVKIDNSHISTMSIPKVLGSQPFVSILCKFSDITTTPKPLSYYKGMYSATRPGLDHYWREVSYSRINLTGSTAVGWYTLPHPLSYYLGSGENLLWYAARDCTGVADPFVDFAQYKGINLIFNSDMDNTSYGGLINMTLDGVTGYRITWIPPWASDLVDISHEMGHSFGMSHSSAYGYDYGSDWDLMSDRWSRCYLAQTKYGCAPQSTISWNKLKLGWISANRRFIAKLGISTVILQQLELPPGSYYLIAQIPIGGSAVDFYTVEVREKAGYDIRVPQNAVIIHRVHVVNDIMIVEAKLITKPREAWVVGQTFIDATNKISIKVISSTETGFKVLINRGQ